MRAVPADACCRDGRCPLTLAAAFGRGDFESGSDSKSFLLRSRTFFPSSRALRRRGGGRCPLTLAAALGRGDFESGSDSKSFLLRSETFFPSSRALRRRGGGRCPLTLAATLGRGDFESGSDSKSFLFRSQTFFPSSRELNREAPQFAYFPIFLYKANRVVFDSICLPERCRRIILLPGVRGAEPRRSPASLIPNPRGFPECSERCFRRLPEF